MKDQCNHEKVHEDSMMMSYPPKQNWICKKCGAKGITVIGIPNKNKECLNHNKRAASKSYLPGSPRGNKEKI
ncbi:hypothetical protein [Bacillus cereus group sp. BfR-BA-01310]|uniref:hypothetical protein n=1 Tax=Bacillus cereus group sp. BfR-BA-01310 TaxID=2920287 RepID=UPI001F5A0D1F|nr:hypothetical protein [Bacillus cereus group sp. BfR-BA-01310]